MAIITLTSDLGDNSHYPAIIKGGIWSLMPGVQLIDVTHNIPNFDLMQAAYVARQVFAAFPKGTVHLLAIDPSLETSPSVVMKYADQYFVGPNNGLMSLISDGKVHEGHEVTQEALHDQRYPRSFRAARVFGPTAAYLAQGGDWNKVGPATRLKDLRWGEPSYHGNCLRGKIIFIDNFGNAVTNIQRQGFLSLKQERRFEIFIRSIRLRRIVNTYADVPKADALAIFGQGDHLEIAMREASAAQLLGLKVNDMITIEFGT